MKKLYAAIGAIVFLTTISAFSKIIVNPDFDNGPVTFSITAIELTDSATRVNKSLVIPVRNGKFAYDLYTDSPLVYKLYIGSEYLNGSLRNICFSSADSDVSIQIPKDINENAVISGGAATNAIKEYENKRRAYLKLNLKETPIGRLYEEFGEVE